MHPSFQGTFEDDPIPNMIVYLPKDVVKHIQGKIKQTDVHLSTSEDCKTNQSLSQESRAQNLISEGKVIHNSQLSCTCAATTKCYHIMTAKMSIGINEKTIPKQWNLTQLRRNAHVIKRKDQVEKDLDQVIVMMALFLMLLGG